MAKQQSRITIDCMLAKGVEGLKGDGCIYEMTSSDLRIANPSTLKVGEYVKVRLWLPEEDSHILIDLAEIQWVQGHWIKIDLVVVSPTGQKRLEQFVKSQGQPSRSRMMTNDQILVRA
jgi:hypothetical protein